MASSSAAETVVRRSRVDPTFYVENVLLGQPTAVQREILDSVRDNPRTAVKSAHGVGKSWVAAHTAIWFLQCFPGSVVLTTAPSFTQVQDVLWRELRLAWNRAKRGAVQGRLFDGAPRLEVERTWFCHGFSTDEAANFQGTHSPHVLVIFDEACGISPEIWESLDGNLTSSHCRFLSIGNPTDPGNPFFAECQNPGTKVFTINAYDSPNFTAFGITEAGMLDGAWRDKITGPLPFPDLTTPEWVVDILEKHGHESAYYQSRVLVGHLSC